MTTIPGASQYLGSATLANTQGTSAATSTVLGESSTSSLLDIGRSSLYDNGIGLSSNARALNNSFLESSASTFNSIFSLGLGATATTEGLQQSILALRSSLPDSAIHDSAFASDDGSVAASDTGQEVDTTA